MKDLTMTDSRYQDQDWIDSTTETVKKLIPEVVAGATKNPTRRGPTDQPLIEQRVTELMTSFDDSREQAISAYIWAVVATDLLSRAFNELVKKDGFQTYNDYYTTHHAIVDLEDQFKPDGGATNDSPN